MRFYMQIKVHDFSNQSNSKWNFDKYCLRLFINDVKIYKL